MNRNIPSLLSEMIGKSCCDIRIRHGNVFLLAMGDKIPYDNPRLKDRYHGEWDLMVEDCAWRVLRDGKFVCGSGDDLEVWDSRVQNLMSLKLKDIIQVSAVDISFLFDKGYEISIIGTSQVDNYFTILCPNNFFAQFNSSGEWIIGDSNEPSEGLTPAESILSEHSENCHNRWKDRVPVGTQGRYCSECYFYRPLEGHFYFWDYGLCSNDKSDNDGKVVSVESGCDKFSTSILIV